MSWVFAKIRMDRLLNDCSRAVWSTSTAVFLFAVFFVSGPMTSAQTTYQFERMWPTLLQPWYLDFPDGIAVHSDGSVYVVDWSCPLNRVQFLVA